MLANDSVTVAIEIPFGCASTILPPSSGSSAFKLRRGLPTPACHNRPSRLPAGQEWRRAHPRLQTGRNYQQADRTAGDLCSGPDPPHTGVAPLRHQMCVVERKIVRSAKEQAKTKHDLCSVHFVWKVRRAVDTSAVQLLIVVGTNVGRV
jgi:hypothetical protein